MKKEIWSKIKEKYKIKFYLSSFFTFKKIHWLRLLSIFSKTKAKLKSLFYIFEKNRKQ